MQGALSSVCDGSPKGPLQTRRHQTVDAGGCGLSGIATGTGPCPSPTATFLCGPWTFPLLPQGFGTFCFSVQNPLPMVWLCGSAVVSAQASHPRKALRGRCWLRSVQCLPSPGAVTSALWCYSLFFYFPAFTWAIYQRTFLAVSVHRNVTWDPAFLIPDKRPRSVRQPPAHHRGGVSACELAEQSRERV